MCVCECGCVTVSLYEQEYECESGCEWVWVGVRRRPWPHWQLGAIHGTGWEWLEGGPMGPLGSHFVLHLWAPLCVWPGFPLQVDARDSLFSTFLYIS